MHDIEVSDRELIDNLVGALNALPKGGARLIVGELPFGNRSGPDAVIEAEIAGHPVLLIVEAKRNAFPRDVREAVWQLRNYHHHLQHPEREIIPFLVATAISNGARETLRAEGMGYFDIGGTLFVPAKSAYILIDRPAPRKSRKIFDTIFQGQRARVLQTIFERKDDWLAVKDVSEAASVSPATASQTLSELERREWMESRGKGPHKARRLLEPIKLVDGWMHYIRNQKPPKLRCFYVSNVDLTELMHQLDSACQRHNADYAVTGEAAAQVYTPHLTNVFQVRCRISPQHAIQAILRDMNAKSVDAGWNLAVIDQRSINSKPLCDHRDGINLAKPLQVYLDLLQGTGRSKDMAAHLRSEGLGL